MGSPDDDGPLCVAGLQHAFAMTAWEQTGADAFSYWVTELLCPTCGTTINRSGNAGDWEWNSPAGT